MKSILDEVRADSLDELFSRDPLSLSDNEIDKMVELYRIKRDVWAKKELAKPPKGAPKAVPVPKTLSLDDLGL